MSPPQEGRYTKIGAIATVVALVLGYLAWKHPTLSRPEGVHPPEISKVQLSTDFDNHHFGDRNGTPTVPPPPTSDLSGTDSGSNYDAASPGRRKSLQGCGVPEVVTLQPGAPAKVASGLAVLSVKLAREGSESYLTLGIATDRVTLAKAVLGTPMRYRFATSRGTYFVNVIDIDRTDDAITVQVGCETRENTP